MLETYFQGIVLTSLIGAAFVLILMLFRPFTTRHFSAGWHYYLWLTVLVAMMVPIRLDLSALEEIPAVSQTIMHAEKAMESALKDIGINKDTAQKQIITDEKGHRLVSARLQEKRAREAAVERCMDTIVAVWGSVALLLFAFKLGSYVLFLRKINKTTEVVQCPQLAEYTKRKVEVRTGEWLGSPLLLGVLRPILLMPAREMSEEQLRNVLSHEMTHLRRNDMLYKWFVVLVKCVHWFNPAVYFVSTRVNQDCEISCDLSVTEGMSKIERMSYVETILALFAEQRQTDYALTMGMSGSKSLLKKRFRKMKNRIVVTEKMRKCSGVAAAVFLLTIMLVSGQMAVKAFPDLESQNLPPSVSECSQCGHDQLYFSRQLAHLKVDDETVVYYVYHYSCDKCGHYWSKRQEVTSRYIIKMSYQKNYQWYTTVVTAGACAYSDPEAQKVVDEAYQLVHADDLDARKLLKTMDKLIEKSNK